MPETHVLNLITEREAVADALYRVVSAFDDNDVSLFNSAMCEDAVFKMGDHVVNGREAMKTQFLDFVGPKDTTHMISNVRVDLKPGAKTASLSAYALAQHCPPGQGCDPSSPYYLSGSRYSLNVVKDEKENLWKVKDWNMKITWLQGDASVLLRE